MFVDMAVCIHFSSQFLAKVDNVFVMMLKIDANMKIYHCSDEDEDAGWLCGLLLRYYEFTISHSEPFYIFESLIIKHNDSYKKLK